jgi:type IV secretory pathway TraG/TraD family ATPase VirD4
MNAFSDFPQHLIRDVLVIVVLVLAVYFGRRWQRRLSRRIRLGGLSWTREVFAAGWLITGGIGTGKTRSGFTRLMHEVFRCEPDWGGLVIDDKGHFHETVLAIARQFGREQDIILLRVEESSDRKPQHRFNLTGNRDIPFLTYGRMVVDTGVAMGQRQDQSFFRTQARDQIAAALEALHLIQCEVTLENAYHLLLDVGELSRVVGELRKLISAPAALRLAHHFEEHYLKQPAEQLGGVQGSIANYLSGFLADPVAEVFFRDSTFSFDDLDRGKIICLAVPQKFAVQRRYLSTFLKQLFYFHALSRYDRCASDRAAHNLLVLWADEAQHFVTDSEEGLSDYNAIDRIREARATVVMATQSIHSFVPPLHREKAEVLRLNLRNRLVFQAATEADAQDAADFLGKRLRQKVTRTFGQRGAQRSYVEEEVHRLKPHQLRLLRPHECVVVHASKRFRRCVLPPLEPDGSVAPWFPWWRKWLG